MELALENTYWPFSESQPLGYKGCVELAFALRTKSLVSGNKTLERFRQFFRYNLERERNVIISSEELSALEVGEIQHLGDMLAGFHTEIVFVYREYITHFTSYYFELNKYLYNNTLSFGSFLLEFESDKIDKINSLRKQPLITLPWFSSVFGKENIVILDYYGMRAANVDIEYALICEVAGVLCKNLNADHDAAEKRNHSQRTNASSSVVLNVIFSLFMNFVKMKLSTCEVCSHMKKLLFEHISFSIKSLANDNPLPLITPSLSILSLYSQQLDADLRKDFGNQIRYGNQSFNYHMAANAIAPEELIIEKFLADPFWNQWMDREVSRANSTGFLCCSSSSTSSLSSSSSPSSSSSSSRQQGHRDRGSKLEDVHHKPRPLRSPESSSQSRWRFFEKSSKW
jgi:hypothetical protein